MTDHLRLYPAIELMLGIIIGIIYSMMWWYNEPRTDEDKVAERQLGANVVLGQLNGIILASTITIGLLGPYAALALSEQQISWVIKAHLSNASIMIFLSIVFAVWSLSLISSYVTKHNVTKCRDVMLLAVVAFFCFVAAICRLGLALWNMLA